MALSLTDDAHEVVLGSGAGFVSLLVGLALAGVVVTDRIALLEGTFVVSVLLVFGFLFGLAGLFDIVALGIPKRGVGHLVTAAGIVLALLAPYGEPTVGFVISGSLALLLSAAYQGALAVDLLQSAEEPAADLDSEGDVS